MSTSASVASIHRPGVRCSNDVPKTTHGLSVGCSNDMAKGTGATVPMPGVRCSNDMAKTTGASIHVQVF